MYDINLKALAKINLGLDVIRKREDGYHEVRMIMQTINLYDKISMKRTRKKEILLQTNLPYLPKNEGNLAYRAADLLREEFQIEDGVFINLEKHIPVAAGLAGGSSDAAAVLVGMNRLFHLRLTRKELMQRAVKLGADVPYCVLRGTALSEGIGEILTPLPAAPKCYVLIAKPNINVSTKLVYENLKIDQLKTHPNIFAMIEAINKGDLYAMVECMGNVLESVTIKEYPVIQKLKDEMLHLGAIASLMSGSGPTVFGIYDNYYLAEKAFYKLKIDDDASKVVLTGFFNQKGEFKNG